jgi:hypothetical protein
MEMLDVDNWDNDVEFSRSADTHLGLQPNQWRCKGGERFLLSGLKKAFAEEKEYDLILSDVDLADRLEGRFSVSSKDTPNLN